MSLASTAPACPLRAVNGGDSDLIYNEYGQPHHQPPERTHLVDHDKASYGHLLEP